MFAGRTQDFQDPIQSTRCTRAAGRLLPQPHRLVLTECPQRGPWVLRVSVECLHQSGTAAVWLSRARYSFFCSSVMGRNGEDVIE